MFGGKILFLRLLVARGIRVMMGAVNQTMAFSHGCKCKTNQSQSKAEMRKHFHKQYPSLEWRWIKVISRESNSIKTAMILQFK